MDNNRISLIRKLISSGYNLSPFETIHMQYLSRKGLLEELMAIELQENPYTAAEKAKGAIHPYYVSYLASLTAQNDPTFLYKSYRYAYESILHQEDNTQKLGYKGLMLLTQLRLMKLEHRQLLSKGEVIHLMNFESFSFLHQRESSYEEVLATLGNTFRYFLKDIDNILTLNYYLNQMIDLDELNCLGLLKMWLNPENYKETSLNEAEICCEESNILFLLDENHANYAESLSLNINNLPIGFSENSLIYVKDVIKKTIEDVSKSSN